MDGIDATGGVGWPAMPATAKATPTAAATPATVAGAAKAAPTEITNIISALADAAPPIDNEKVHAITSLIASGAYPIDSRAIAAKMLALDFPARAVAGHA